MIAGRPAVAVGCSVDGERAPAEHPWRVSVDHGETVLHCRWPAGPTSLRGAVVAALGPAAHVDHHNHLEDGTTRQARATVCYRVHDDHPVVFAYGPRAASHLQAVARIGMLRLPGGSEVTVDGAEMQVETTEVGLSKDAWHAYELVTPYFPSSVAYARRPRQRGPERRAWAGQAIASSIRVWLADLGVETPAHRPVHVQIDDGEDVRVRWRQREEAVRSGFVARFTTNAILPAGVGLGQHIAEGFGEVRPC